MNPRPQIDAEFYEVLLTELHHRFYNSLQVLSSLAGRLRRAGMSDDEHDRTVVQLQQRFEVIGRLHRLLAQPHGSDLPRSCKDLCRTVASAFGREDARIEVSMPCLPIDAAVIQGFFLLLTELVTNAMKHTGVSDVVAIDVELLPMARGKCLRVVSSGRTGACSSTPLPRIASQLARQMGGSLSVHGGPDYRVEVMLPAL